MYFAEFTSCVTEKPAKAGSVILDCMLSLYSALIVDNSALQVSFYDLSIPF